MQDAFTLSLMAKTVSQPRLQESCSSQSLARKNVFKLITSAMAAVIGEELDS